MRVVIALRNEHLLRGEDARRGGSAAAACTIRPMPQPAAAHRRLTTLLLAALAIAACSPNAPTGTPSLTPSPAASPSPGPTAAPVDELAIYRQIEDEVIEIRGLEPTTRLTPT